LWISLKKECPVFALYKTVRPFFWDTNKFAFVKRFNSRWTEFVDSPNSLDSSLRYALVSGLIKKN